MIRTLIVLAVVTVLPLAPAEQTAVVPLAQDLVFTTTSHSALVAGDRSLPVADTEVVFPIETADADRIQFTFSSALRVMPRRPALSMPCRTGSNGRSGARTSARPRE